MGYHLIEIGSISSRLLLAEMTQDIRVAPVLNNQHEVAQFNQGMIFQARQYAFCSQKEVMGATVQEP